MLLTAKEKGAVKIKIYKEIFGNISLNMGESEPYTCERPAKEGL